MTTVYLMVVRRPGRMEEIRAYADEESREEALQKIAERMGRFGRWATEVVYRQTDLEKFRGNHKHHKIHGHETDFISEFHRETYRPPEEVQASTRLRRE